MTGAAVYRVPVDDTALTFQLGQQAERPADPERTERLHRVSQAIQEAQERADGGQISLQDAGLTDDDYTRYQADLAEELRPPVEAPDGLAAAVAAARAAGLLTPIPRHDEGPFHFVHRWTASALAQLYPDTTSEAHRRAAAFWHWRIDTLPQTREQDIDQLLEARYHHHAASDLDEAIQATEIAVLQLQTWGQYGRAAGLCRQTLTWLQPGTPKAAAFHHQLGILAYLRGDYDTAEASYRQSLTIDEQLGDQAGMASSYHQLGILAQARGDYDTAEQRYRQSLDIFERLGNQAGMAGSYGQLGTLAHDRGDHDTADQRYRQALDIFERLGDQAGMATSYHQLGILAQNRGDHDTADQRYHQALDISERLGDQAAMAGSYGQLGILAQDRGDHDTADQRYRQALDIFERLGNQAGMAGSYHQLGILAHLRGDHDTAERRYRQSLDISERLGDQASIATSYSALAALRESLGKTDEAVTYHVRTRNTLRAALNHAKDSEELLSRNPAALAKVPSAPKRRRRGSVWSVEEASRFLASARDGHDPMYAAYVLILVNGLRRGEVLGLTWPSVDLDSGEIEIGWQLQRIRGELIHKKRVKTEDSDADDTVPMPDICTSVLKLRHDEQDAARRKARDRWQSSDLVFTTKWGTPIEPRNFYRSFQARCTKAGVPSIRVHDTRH